MEPDLPRAFAAQDHLHLHQGGQLFCAEIDAGPALPSAAASEEQDQRSHSRDPEASFPEFSRWLRWLGVGARSMEIISPSPIPILLCDSVTDLEASSPTLSPTPLPAGMSLLCWPEEVEGLLSSVVYMARGRTSSPWVSSHGAGRIGNFLFFFTECILIMFFSFQHLPDSPCLTTYSTLFSLCFSKQNTPPPPLQAPKPLKPFLLVLKRKCT